MCACVCLQTHVCQKIRDTLTAAPAVQREALRVHWEGTRVAQGPECCLPLPSLRSMELPHREASELCVRSSWTHQAKNQLPADASEVNLGSSAGKASNSICPITWAQLRMIGTRCLCGIGKEGSLPTTLVLLLYLPSGGFQGKLFPRQGAAMCENKQKLP